MRRDLPADVVSLVAHPCACAEGQCQAGGKHKRCPHRWARRAFVKTMPCRTCKCVVWTVDGKCVRCEAKKRRKQAATFKP